MQNKKLLAFTQPQGPYVLHGFRWSHHEEGKKTGKKSEKWLQRNDSHPPKEQGLYSLVLSCPCYPALGGSWAAARSCLWGRCSAVEDPADVMGNSWACRILCTTLCIKRTLPTLLLMHSTTSISLGFFPQMGKLRLAQPDWQLAIEPEESHGWIPEVISWSVSHWSRKDSYNTSPRFFCVASGIGGFLYSQGIDCKKMESL